MKTRDNGLLTIVKGKNTPTVGVESTASISFFQNLFEQISSIDPKGFNPGGNRGIKVARFVLQEKMLPEVSSKFAKNDLFYQDIPSQFTL